VGGKVGGGGGGARTQKKKPLHQIFVGLSIEHSNVEKFGDVHDRSMDQPLALLLPGDTPHLRRYPVKGLPQLKGATAALVVLEPFRDPAIYYLT
jgi:hypothetical protein